ncbi:MAG: hypothetical protein HRU76_03600 [Phycisphaeraceae bacterium]|nr:hypothetical protein [Phycisphaerales bacterium]QOJ16726.1 MAG: hypothetical protein HRU76_03600 [Phycisphaeraceae bacterium]
MTSGTINPAPPSDERQQKRLGNLGGDRLCLSCQYNLKHQPYWREPRYGLLMVRCPECGLAASLEDQPVILSRFAASVTWLIALPWVALMLMFLLAIAGGTFGFAMLATMVAVEPFMFGATKSHWFELNWYFLIPLGLACLVAFIGGLCWRVITCGAGPWLTRWSFIGLILLLGFFGWLAIDDWRGAMAYSNYYYSLATIGSVVLAPTQGVAVLAYALGLMSGRRLGALGLRLIRRDVEMLPGFSR